MNHPTIDPSSDQTARTLYLPHEGYPGCGYTLLMDEEIDLYRLGILPVQCKSCCELMTDMEGA
jgi:hypothetical protein